MQKIDAPTRQSMGCGYEPPAPEGRAVLPYTHAGYGGPIPTTCPGYTVKLPDVMEANRARFWKHDLRVFTAGEAPSEALLAAVELLEAETNAMRIWESSDEGRRARGETR